MCNASVEFKINIRKISGRRSRQSKIRRTWSFHVVILQRTAKKCANIYNARAQPLICSFNLCFVAFSSPLPLWFAKVRIYDGDGEDDA